MNFLINSCRGAWRYAVMAFAVVGMSMFAQPTAAIAQCDLEIDEEGCNFYSEESRIRDLAANGCHVRVYYRIIKCDEDCFLQIDSLVYPTFLGDCSNCVHDLTKANIDAIVRHLILHGMYFSDCGPLPDGSVTVLMPACWKQYSGGAGGGGFTNMGACGPLPCCVVVWTITQTNGYITGLSAGTPSPSSGTYDCSIYGGGCSDICN